jgi:serine/threonine protein kinase
MSGIKFLHDNNVVHRNIKPRFVCDAYKRRYRRVHIFKIPAKLSRYIFCLYIFFSSLFFKNGILKIGGFGVASSSGSIKASFSKGENFNYLAPEVIEEKTSLTPQIDIW